LKDKHWQQKFSPQDQIISNQGNNNPHKTENTTKHNKKYRKTSEKLQAKNNHSG
jgi:hypothetical protein